MTVRLMGDTEECFQHFKDAFPPDATKSTLAEFCQISVDTVGRWVRGANKPLGDELIRLRVFLQLAGYTVHELVDLNRTSRTLAQIIALEVYSLEEIKDMLGYRNIDAVYGIVLRGLGVMPNKVPRLERIVENSSDELEKKLALWRARIEDLLEDEDELQRRAIHANTIVSPAVAPIVEAEPEPTLTTSVVNHLVGALNATLENAATTPEQRKRIVNMVGEGRLNKLITALQMLDT